MVDLRIKLTGWDTPIQLLGRLSKHLDNLTPIKRQLGEIVRDAIKDYIEKGGTYEKGGGDIWPATDFKYAELEGKDHRRPLYWTGDLYKSIVYAVRRSGVAIGSPLPYAPWVMLADGATPRHYAREEVSGKWIPRGQVVQRGSAFVARKSGFRSYTTVIQRRDVLRFFAEDVTALLKWLELDILGGTASGYSSP